LPAAAEAYYPLLPRLDDDDEYAIGDEGPGREGQNDEYHIQEEEERSESDDGMEREDDSYSYGSGGDNGVESEQQHDEDDDIGEEQSEGERVQQVVSDRSDGENGVEDEQQAGEEAPAPQPHDAQGNVAAVEDSDDDRPISVVSRARTLVHGASTTSTAPARAPPESPPAPPSFSDSSSVIRNVTVDVIHYITDS
jgi:hypothetical protein